MADEDDTFEVGTPSGGTATVDATTGRVVSVSEPSDSGGSTSRDTSGGASREDRRGISFPAPGGSKSGSLGEPEVDEEARRIESSQDRDVREVNRREAIPIEEQPPKREPAAEGGGMAFPGEQTERRQRATAEDVIEAAKERRRRDRGGRGGPSREDRRGVTFPAPSEERQRDTSPDPGPVEADGSRADEDGTTLFGEELGGDPVGIVRRGPDPERVEAEPPKTEPAAEGGGTLGLPTAEEVTEASRKRVEEGIAGGAIEAHQPDEPLGIEVVGSGKGGRVRAEVGGERIEGTRAEVAQALEAEVLESRPALTEADVRIVESGTGGLEAEFTKSGRIGATERAFLEANPRFEAEDIRVVEEADRLDVELTEEGVERVEEINLLEARLDEDSELEKEFLSRRRRANRASADDGLDIDGLLEEVEQQVETAVGSQRASRAAVVHPGFRQAFFENVDLERGEDFTVEFERTGGGLSVTAELTSEFKRREAASQFERQLEARSGIDFIPGVDFVVEETEDGGLTADLTTSGEDKLATAPLTKEIERIDRKVSGIGVVEPVEFEVVQVEDSPGLRAARVSGRLHPQFEPLREGSATVGSFRRQTRTERFEVGDILADAERTVFGEREVVPGRFTAPRERVDKEPVIGGPLAEGVTEERDLGQTDIPFPVVDLADFGETVSTGPTPESRAARLTGQLHPQFEPLMETEGGGGSFRKRTEPPRTIGRAEDNTLEAFLKDLDKEIAEEIEFETLPAGARPVTPGRGAAPRERVPFEEAPEDHQLAAFVLEGATEAGPRFLTGGTLLAKNVGDFTVAVAEAGAPDLDSLGAETVIVEDSKAFRAARVSGRLHPQFEPLREGSATVGSFRRQTEGGLDQLGPDLERVDQLITDAGQVAANAASVGAAQFIKEPEETAARAVGTLATSAVLFGGAAAVGPRTSLFARGLIQPGEEAAGIGGFAATRAVAGRGAAQRLFPNKEPLIFSEEAFLRGVRRVGGRASDIRIPRFETTQLEESFAEMQTEATLMGIRSGMRFGFPRIEIEAETKTRVPRGRTDIDRDVDDAMGDVERDVGTGGEEGGGGRIGGGRFVEVEQRDPGTGQVTILRKRVEAEPISRPAEFESAVEREPVGVRVQPGDLGLGLESPGELGKVSPGEAAGLAEAAGEGSLFDELGDTFSDIDQDVDDAVELLLEGELEGEQEGEFEREGEVEREPAESELELLVEAEAELELELEAEFEPAEFELEVAGGRPLDDSFGDGTEFGIETFSRKFEFLRTTKPFDEISADIEAVDAAIADVNPRGSAARKRRTAPGSGLDPLADLEDIDAALAELDELDLEF